mgnify:CR=1 FL=1
MKLPLLREPLLHFLVLGAALFGLFSLVGKKDAEAPAKIVVSASRVATLADGFARTWRRPPTEQELQGLIEDYIRDEIFYREGRAAGLDRDDVVIRRRVRQKMEFLAEDAAAAEPSDEAARGLTWHPIRNGSGPRTGSHSVRSFERNAARQRAGRRRPADRRDTCPRERREVDTATIGDPFLLGEEFREMSQSDVATHFRRRLRQAAVRRGTGPLAGAHPVELRSCISSSSKSERREACRRSLASGRPCSGSG